MCSVDCARISAVIHSNAFFGVNFNSPSTMSNLSYAPPLPAPPLPAPPLQPAHRIVPPMAQRSAFALGARVSISSQRIRPCICATRTQIVICATRSPLDIVRDAQRVYSAEKPPWCQPWTIVGTGSLSVATAWSQLHGAIGISVAAIISAAVLVWWYLFLVLYPQSRLGE